MAAPATTVIRGNRVLIDGAFRPAAVWLAGGRIARVGAVSEPSPGGVVEVVDAGDLAVIPGVIDAHIHINEPGRTDWEGFESATNAAAVGGVTTLIDMPLNSSPVTTTPGALRQKLDCARGKLRVNVGFWGGLVPANTGGLGELLDAGVLGIKCFLVHSGIDEFPGVGRNELEPAMRVIARHAGVLLAHAEDPGVIGASAPTEPRPDGRSYQDYLRSRPPGAEVAAIRMLLDLCERTGCRLHIVHLATEEALPMMRDARRRGLPVSVETCPHYLTFAAEDIPDGATRFKCAPPIRGRRTREALWEALRAGDIDLVASDHSPCPPALKLEDRGDFFGAWGGIASVQFLFSATWTGARQRGVTLEQVCRWLCEQPARLAGLAHRKGRIAPGYDADLVMLDPDAEFVVTPPMIHHRHKLTPYGGLRLRGLAARTIVGGATVYQDGAFVGAAGACALLRDAADRRTA